MEPPLRLADGAWHAVSRQRPPAQSAMAYPLRSCLLATRLAERPGLVHQDRVAERCCTRSMRWDGRAVPEHVRGDVVEIAAMYSALEVVADYMDLKSPWTAGHSRGVAELRMQAAEAAGMPATDCATIRRAGRVDDLGRCGVHNGSGTDPNP